MQLEHRALNSPFDDPMVFVRVNGFRMLFDLGWTDFTAAGIFPADAIFISHMHFDHFAGFDAMLRFSWEKTPTVHLFGPEGIADIIRHRLHGFTWNLASADALTVTVTELLPDRQRHFRYRIKGDLAGSTLPETVRDNIAFETDAYRVRYILLDHGITSVGYSLECAEEVKVDKAALSAFGARPGKWTGQLVQAIREGTGGGPFTIDDRDFQLDELRHMVTIEPGRKIVYLTDFIFQPERLEEIARFAHAADCLYCEAFFSSDDAELARRNFHLTTPQCDHIAKAAEVKELRVVHVSHRYAGKGMDAIGPSSASVDSPAL